ncbi:Retrovirus-related Pol polyprotein from transposon 17.6 [Labeo rohita]|uniref:Gypsy retrotransposon integrase-like protein 1 n=1 Tax=Labeo rohita TaxID=84645 RepID=A0ABQ8KZW2_LABRO|nr:Retrovirus-related Pol polyprotein from transposon 17.6 [Labeo rohita]
MPLRLCNAPSTFQQLMEQLLGDQQCHSLLLYLDDVVVFSSSVNEHLARMEVVLSRLLREGLKAKLSKVEAVAQWPRPTNVSELRSFLGFASYYWRFAEGFVAQVFSAFLALKRKLPPTPEERKKLSKLAVILLQQWGRLVETDGRHYWPGMSADVSRWYQECERCQCAKGVPSVPEWFCKFGMPGHIHSDQGRNFESTLIQQLCTLYGVEKSRTTPYHPAGSGQCEHFNRTLPDLLRPLPHFPKREPNLCVLFGQEPKFPFDFLLGRVQEPSAGSVHRFWSRRISCELRFEGACERLDAAANRRKARHDLPVREAALKDGQLAYLHDYSMRGRCKIQDLWSSVVYQVMRVPKECGPVYTIAPITDLGKACAPISAKGFDRPGFTS